MPDVAMGARPRLASYARLQWDPTREAHVLLAPEGVLVLNPTASAILDLCDGRRSVADIVTDLSGRYNRDVDRDILTFLGRLARKKLIDFAHDQ